MTCYFNTSMINIPVIKAKYISNKHSAGESYFLKWTYFYIFIEFLLKKYYIRLIMEASFYFEKMKLWLYSCSYFSQNVILYLTIVTLFLLIATL